MRRKIAIASLVLIVGGIAFGVFAVTQLSAGKKTVSVESFDEEQTFVLRAPSWPFRKEVLFVEVIGQLSAPVPITIRVDGEELHDAEWLPPGRVIYETFGKYQYKPKELEVTLLPSKARGSIKIDMRCGR